VSAEKQINFPTADELRQRLQDSSTQLKGGAANVSVWMKGEVLNFSFDENGALLPAGKESLWTMPAICVTKTLTAILTIRLLAGKNISLDTPVSDVIADVTGSSPRLSNVLVHHLLNYSHGLDDTELQRYPTHDDRRLDLAALWERFTASPPLFEPGQYFSYNDSGAALAGAVLEALSGKGYTELLAESLLAELGLVADKEEGGSRLARICPTFGGALKINSAQLIDVARYFCGLSPSGRVGSDELKIMLSRSASMAGWSYMGTGSYLGLNTYDEGWYGYAAGDPTVGSLILRFNPKSNCAIAATAKGGEALQRALAAVGGLFFERAELSLPRPLFGAALEAVDVEALVGTYVTGPLTATIIPGATDGASMTVRNRNENVKYLAEPMHRNLRFAERNAFFTVPVEPRTFPFGQGIDGSASQAQKQYLWNGRRLWRRVAD
jgi:CubicO group peptidase (beta-lactamase class C family)